MTYYEFNPFTGRLKESTRFQPYYPLKPSALSKVEQTLIWDTMKTKPAEVKSAASVSSSSSSVDPKLLEKYKFFQRDIHKPVYLMGGTKDKILFGITIALTCYIAVDTARFLYDLSKK
ncbi:PREDICTED: uncharacterized protein LOC107070764 [Polistes dominula]|uniref:Uncharacterized protein LOC107070764 n=1 Tax=Polistes dominula TaxID=743375 RepID=A0ABM1IX08_POLDO|nr:PREDICTED: uncharacterized protein LOC107070764 [Polistes dominula]